MSCIVNKILKEEQKKRKKKEFLKSLPLNLSSLPQKDCRYTVQVQGTEKDEVNLHRLTRSYLQDNVFMELSRVVCVFYKVADANQFFPKKKQEEKN